MCFGAELGWGRLWWDVPPALVKGKIGRNKPRVGVSGTAARSECAQQDQGGFLGGDTHGGAPRAPQPPPAADVSPQPLAFVLIRLGFAFPPRITQRAVDAQRSTHPVREPQPRPAGGN